MTHLSNFELRLPRVDSIGAVTELPVPVPEPHRPDASEYDRMRDYILMVDLYVARLRELLPGQKREMEVFDTLEAFEGAVKDLSTLLGACIDYRNLLIRANVPDSVSGRHEGVEAIYDRYGIIVSKRSEYGEALYHAIQTN